MLGSVIQLDGDSCTPETSIGYPLRPRLEAHASAWTSQLDLLQAAGAQELDRNIRRRVALLDRAISDAEGTVVIARSSGARVATLLATRRRMRAVICLGYPFQRPRQPPEPARYEHLEHVLAPTLILQGIHDSYGGRGILDKYAFSPAVTVEFVDACHKFRIPPARWDAIAARILRFCAELPAAPPG
ncbi:alpha/beta family hydrolase [Sediminicoccus rosea]|uniref:Alpha/beta family hydrolase n=1 Tax=Sediminicoccus rosea TaxID=1225128 RepID=A0ABZ0PD82_9PROT|nr:alpha/beta family hydrolase [Sediminicoccus rosea]WPB83536.1 alpha/beta family hydrolase [Sediminicoccus rosea]